MKDHKFRKGKKQDKIHKDFNRSIKSSGNNVMLCNVKNLIEKVLKLSEAVSINSSSELTMLYLYNTVYTLLDKMSYISKEDLILSITQ